MTLPVFQLEDYFEPLEHRAAYLFSSSDLQTMPMQELVAMADTECRSLWENLTLGYTEARGFLPLREEICRTYHGLGPENILVCAGAEEAIFAVFSSLLTATDHAMAIVPGYESLHAIPASLCDLTTIPLDENNQWALDLDAVHAVIRPNTKLMIINFPHNPTGALLPRSVFDALIAMARQHNLYVFSDEVYRLMEIDPADRLPAAAEVYEKGISLAVMSKAYGLAGIRIGWIASADRQVIQKALQYKYYLTICNSAPSEILALMGLRNQEYILHRNHTLMCQNLTLLDQFFTRHPAQFAWVRPKAGCTGFVRFLGAMPIETLAEDLLDTTGVMILPGSVYHWPGNYFRVGYGRANMPAALEHFEAFLDKSLRAHPLTGGK